ncbi:MAG: hypothetical protein Q7T25_02400 [Sideroxyarcus sp.]|nr:hypothetical protein [Sideroxyarcus sp.]
MINIRLKLVKGGREGELIAQGWIKQTTIGEPRLSEIVNNYRNMGYEVSVIEHTVVESEDDCNCCYSADAKTVQVVGDIYTRCSGALKPLEDELF